jgi:hypothetical protein
MSSREVRRSADATHHYLCCSGAGGYLASKTTLCITMVFGMLHIHWATRSELFDTLSGVLKNGEVFFVSFSSSLLFV